MRFKIFPNLDRLRIVNDICPLLGFPSNDGWYWKGVTASSVVPVIEHQNGYTVTDWQNRFVTWHRTFTRDFNVPNLPVKSFIHIHEWIPSREPPQSITDTLKKSKRKFFKFTADHFEAVAILTPDFVTSWGAKTRYHLTKTQKNPHLKLRLGTFDELSTIMECSQVPKIFHDSQLDLAKKHLKAHPQDIEILIATLDEVPVACFVAGYCTDAKEGSYLVGCFTEEERKSRAMLALVHWWFQRCLDRGMKQANFGGMVGPRPFLFDSQIGFSDFKTHFNIHRVWMPGSYWNITTSFK